MMRSISWNLTHACNMKCVHCYTGSATGSHKELNLGEIEEGLRDFLDVNVEKFFLSGGEVLLRDDVVKLARLFSSKGKTCLLSNGSMLTPNIAEALATVGLKDVHISMEVVDKDIFERIRCGASFIDVVRGVRAAFMAGHQVTINVVAMRPVLGNVERIFKFAALLGCHKVDLRRYVPISRGRANFSWLGLKPFELRKFFAEWCQVSSHYGAVVGSFVHDPLYAVYLAEERVTSQSNFSGCLAGKEWLGIAPDGTVYPCPLLGQPTLGNIKTHLLSECITAASKWATHAGRSNCDFEQFCQLGCKAWRNMYSLTCDQMCWRHLRSISFENSANPTSKMVTDDHCSGNNCPECCTD